MRRLAAPTLLAALAIAAPAAAQAKTEVAESGTIRAEFSYTEHGNHPPTALVERIFDGGQLIVENTLPDDQALQPAFVDGPSVHALDLDGDGKAEVIFDVFTGGAHCCFESEFYNGTSHFKQKWGNVGYTRKDYDGDGLPEFKSADDAFSAAYTAYAASEQPLKVLRYDPAGFLVDVTRDASVRPDLRKEAKRLRRRYTRRAGHHGVAAQQFILSALAGYAADECSLGHCAKGYALIRRAVARGDVGKFPHFLGTVRKDLRRLDYDTGGATCACTAPPPAPDPVPQPPA